MKQLYKLATIVLGLLGIGIASLIISLISESTFLAVKDLPVFLSAILFCSSVSILAKIANSPWYLNPLFLILLIVVSFFIPLSNENRWLMLFLASVCALLIHYNEYDALKFLAISLRFTGILLMLKILFLVLSKAPEYLLQFFSFGYDNAFHFAIYRYHRADPWFPFAIQTQWGTDFGLFRTYPSGQAAFWSFLAEPIIGDGLGAEKNLVVYALINLVILLVMNWLSVRCIRQYSDKRAVNSVFIVAVCLVVSIGYFGIFFTNGFIPYAAGIVVILTYLRVQELSLNESSRYLSVFFATLILLLTSPALIAFLFLPGLITSVKFFRDAYLSGRHLRMVVMSTVSTTLVLIGYSFQKLTSSNFGWRQILSSGGVIKPNISVALLLFLTILLVAVLRWKWIQGNSAIQVVLSGALSVGLLCAVTLIFTGSVQYYAVKQLHVWLVFAALGVATLLTSLHISPIVGNSLRLGLVLLLFVPLVTSTSIRLGWMGNMIGAMSSTVDKSKWEIQIVDIDLIRSGLEISKAEKFASTECLIIKTQGLESDLNSRWINALNKEPSITNNCFAAFWNSAPLSTLDLVARLKELEGDFLILTDVNQDEPLPIDSNYQFAQISK